MTWTKLDDSISDHPKVLAAGPIGELLYLRALTYANRYGTDGWISPAALQQLVRGLDQVAIRVTNGRLIPDWEAPDPEALASELVRVRLWELSRRRQGGWRIHDFTDYNPTSAQARHVQSLRKSAGSAGGKASAKSRRASFASRLLRADAEKKPSRQEG